jgi:hypothetical protein
MGCERMAARHPDMRELWLQMAADWRYMARVRSTSRALEDWRLAVLNQSLVAGSVK